MSLPRARTSGIHGAVLYLAAAIFAAASAGCGYIGDTKPPALDIPSRVVDLRAAEYGSNIAVEFTLPPLTTEGLELKNLRSVEVRITGEGQERTYPVPAKGAGPVAHDIPAREWIGRQATITVHATGPKGKTSEWSNAVTLSVGLPLEAPAGLEARSAPEGVQLSWRAAAASPGYRVFRSAGDAIPERLAESTMTAYMDASAAFGTRYRYMIQALDGELRQSELSNPVEITPKDEFPPGVPGGISAVAGADAIELSWERNTEDDFAGYVVYRAAGDAAFERLAGPIEAPVFSDRAIETGKRYRYSVTAIDAAGNESARSAVTEATAQ